MVLGDEYDIMINDIDQGSYEQCKTIWNRHHGAPNGSLNFFNFCVRMWLELKPLNDMASSPVSRNFGMGHLYAMPYSYFRDTVIIGAQAELENICGRWYRNCTTGIRTVQYLRGTRFNAASEYETNQPILDTEDEYFADCAELELDDASE